MQACSFRVFAIVVFIFANLSCNRAMPDPTLKIRVSPPSRSGLSVGENLNVVIINVHIPGRPPIVREIEFRNSSISTGAPIDIEIPNVAAANGALVQFLGVYENTNDGSMKFYYGDKSTNISGTSTAVSIDATNIGSGSGMLQVAGRLLSTSNSGPTGTLIAQVEPPGGKPKMSVTKSSIVNGWFKAFAVDSASFKFDYLLAESGQTLIEDLGPSAPYLATGAYMVRIKSPIAFQNEDGSIRARPETTYFLGFIPAPGADNSVLTGHTVCYPNNTRESLPGVYTTSGQTLQMIFDTTGTGVANAEIVVEAGGAWRALSGHYTTPAGCDPAADGIWLYHQKLSREDKWAGFQPPFAMLRPFRTTGGEFLEVISTASTSAQLNWKLLAGASSGFDGYDIWARYSMNSSSDGGSGKEGCESLSAKGFTEVTSVTPSSTETFTFTGTTSQSYSGTSLWNWRFAVCPYRNFLGAKVAVGAMLTSDCTGTCGETEHFGWGTQSGSVSGQFTTTAQGIVKRVDSIDNSNAYYSDLTISGTSAFNFAAGDEALLTVTAAGSDSACGPNIAVGTHEFVRVLDGSASNLKIPHGTFVDRLTAAGADLSNPGTAGTGFCHLLAVKIPHYVDLTLNSNIPAYAHAFTSTFGGFVGYRVSGTFDMQSYSLDASGKGFLGGDISTYPIGGGVRGDKSTAAPTETGGSNGTNGGGGGGFGAGGNGNAGGAGGSGNSSNSGDLRFLFGSGGGASTADSAGGIGGGAVFLMARTLTATSGGLIASGTIGGASLNEGGGGGGGSINMFVRELVSGSNLAITSEGGNGGGADGGGGGGGYQRSMICDNNGTVTVSTNGGTGGNSGSSGNSNSLVSPVSDYYICK